MRHQLKPIKEQFSRTHSFWRALGSTLIFGFLLLIPMLSWSLKNDHVQPYIFSADRMSYHRHPHCAVYLGHVDIHEGSSEIIGDKVIVYFSNSQNITKMYAWGHPARYTTLPDNKKTKMLAEAQQIIYDVSKKTADLIKNAEIDQDHDELQGEHLCYDAAKQEVVSLAMVEKNKTTITLAPQ